MRLRRHTDQWWFEPNLPKNKVRVPVRLKNHDPMQSGESLPKPRLKGKVGGFSPSSMWVRYNRLQPLDAGYIVPLYDLNQIALRYGFSQNGKRYFRTNILPEPYDIVRRRSVHAHHWSRFVLMALDVVLKDLEDRGYQQFLKRFDDHVQLLHDGVAFMEDYYSQRYEEIDLSTADNFGVEWYR